MAPRTVLVTGASSGIGAAIARAVAGSQTSLFLTARTNADGLAEVADEARAAGSAVETLLADLTKPGAAAGIVGAMRAAFGRVDQIVSNAGKAQKARYGEFGREELSAALAVNAVPFVELASAALDDLAGSGCGRVVALSSFVARNVGVNDTFFPATAAAKGALEAMVRTLAMQLAPTGATVNCVAPGHTRKVGGHAALPPEAWQAAARATPSGRIAEPADVAHAVAFFLSPGAAHVTGQLLRVDGGLCLR